MDNPYYIYNQKPWQNVPFNNSSQMNYYMGSNLKEPVSSSQTQQPANVSTPFYYTSNVPIALAKSLEGKYFLGVAEDLNFGEATHAWARLYNPPDSGVNLFVNVWTVSDVISSPIRVQVWFNSTPPGIIQVSPFVTPANTALSPLPQPKVRLEYAIGTRGFPRGGIKAFGRSGPPGVTIESEEDGKFIFPPGGSFLVFISNPETPTQPASGRVAFGWWEEPIQQ